MSSLPMHPVGAQVAPSNPWQHPAWHLRPRPEKPMQHAHACLFSSFSLISAHLNWHPQSGPRGAQAHCHGVTLPMRCTKSTEDLKIQKSSRTTQCPLHNLNANIHEALQTQASGGLAMFHVGLTRLDSACDFLLLAPRCCPCCPSGALVWGCYDQCWHFLQRRPLGTSQ